MKKIIWKLIYRIIGKWRDEESTKGSRTRYADCIQIQNFLEHYAEELAKDGVWEE